MIEPLSVGFHAALQGKAQFGQTAVVMGAGCIGIVTMMALKALGVSLVYVVDVLQKRLDKAMELGADQTINNSKIDVVELIKKLTDGAGCDLVIETSGNEVCAKQGIAVLKSGGRFVQVGFSATGDMNLPVSMMLSKEITYKTVFRYRNIYSIAIKAVEEGKINLKGIVTDIFDFDDVQNAMDSSINRKSEIVKAVIKI